jgi:hypothetical protein
VHLTVTSVDYRPHGIAAITLASDDSEAEAGGDVVPAVPKEHDDETFEAESTPTLILGDTAMLHRITRGRTLTSAEWDSIRDSR